MMHYKVCGNNKHSWQSLIWWTFARDQNEVVSGKVTGTWNNHTMCMTINTLIQWKKELFVRANLRITTSMEVGFYVLKTIAEAHKFSKVCIGGLNMCCVHHRKKNVTHIVFWKKSSYSWEISSSKTKINSDRHTETMAKLEAQSLNKTIGNDNYCVLCSFHLEGEKIKLTKNLFLVKTWSNHV